MGDELHSLNVYPLGHRQQVVSPGQALDVRYHHEGYSSTSYKQSEARNSELCRLSQSGPVSYGQIHHII